MKITCTTKDSLPICDLTELQAGLKKRKKRDIDRIINSIDKHGFATPFFVWRKKEINYVLDGHGRLEALRKLEISQDTQVPVVYIQCKNRAEAKELLLKITSNFGKISKEGFSDFLNDIPEFDMESVDLAFDMDKLNTLSSEEEEQQQETDKHNGVLVLYLEPDIIEDFENEQGAESDDNFVAKLLSIYKEIGK